MTAVRIVACLVTLLALSSLRAAPLFEDSAIIDAVLEGPLGDLVHNPESRDQLPFALRVVGTEHAIKVRLRGKSRLRVCDFLPLRLNFRKSEVDGTLFAGQDKLKLVVPCHTSERAQKNLLEEYAIYRMFNTLTPASYRVRLLHTTFEDTAAHGEPATLYSFLLEPETQLVARLGGQRSDRAEVALGWLDPQQIALVYVFQYLVGNLDWSLVLADGEDRCCHNATLVETGAGLLYVPYDFDLSGFVDAPYAIPPPELHIDRVTQRRYRGFCTDRAYLQQALRTIVAKRPEIVEIVQSLPVLTDKDKSRRIAYLDRFFRAAANEERLLDRFERRCID